MESDPQSFAKRLVRQRRAVYLTQAAVAAKLGVTQSAVARWESGKTVPALRHRLPLAQVLCISPHVLYEGVDEGVAA